MLIILHGSKFDFFNLFQRALIVSSVLPLLIFATGCAPGIPKAALELRPESLALRQLQTRRFDTKNEKQLLVAAAQLLQDVGFQIDESEIGLGVIVASKDADASEVSQQIAAVVVAVLVGANTPTDSHQKIRASVVTRPVSKSETALRVTLQRTIWNTNNQISKIERVEDPKMYQEFFDKLSKAVFLTANEL